ncbi:hypothetical protein M9458_043419, partial [Cirrhinus mrigala]
GIRILNYIDDWLIRAQSEQMAVQHRGVVLTHMKGTGMVWDFGHDADTRSSLQWQDCVQRDTFWPAVHETPTVVAQDQGVLPKGKPVSHDQGHAAMPTCLGNGPVLGVPCRRVMQATDA